MFKVFINVKKVEDDFENGEIGEPKEVFSSALPIGEGNDIEEAIKDALNNLGLFQKASWWDWKKEILTAIDFNDYMYNNFVVYFNEKENGERVLSAKDEAAWRKRELKVWSVMYNFTIFDTKFEKRNESNVPVIVPTSKVKSFLRKTE